MVEPSRPPQPEEALFTAVREEAEPKPWAAIIIVLVLLAVLLGLFVLLARGPRRTAAGANPYATQISFSDAKTTQVQNFLGQKIVIPQNGNLNLGATQHLNSLTINAGLAKILAGTTKTNSLTLAGATNAWTGALDLTTRKLNWKPRPQSEKTSKRHSPLSSSEKASIAGVLQRLRVWTKAALRSVLSCSS